MAKGDLEQLSAFFNRLAGLPNPEDFVLGTATVLGVNAPKGWAPFQECRLEVALSAEGVEPATVELEYAAPRKAWPVVGQVFRAHVHKTEPTYTELVWPSPPKSRAGR